MKRPSLQNRSARTNGFFEHFHAEIWNALVDDADGTKENLRQFYVTSRRHQASESEIERILARVPLELSNLFRASRGVDDAIETDETLRVGYYELDIINFLLNIRSNRVLNLVGSVGVGKTTFLSYVFDELRRNLKSLDRFVPIRVSFTRYPKQTLREADLFQMVLQKTLEALQGEIEWRDTAFEHWFRSKHAHLCVFGSETRRSALVELIETIKILLCGEANPFEPVFLFDNLDQ